MSFRKWHEYLIWGLQSEAKRGGYVSWILARQAAASATLVTTGDEGSGYQETMCPSSFFLIWFLFFPPMHNVVNDFSI